MEYAATDDYLVIYGRPWISWLDPYHTRFNFRRRSEIVLSNLNDKLKASLEHQQYNLRL